MRKTVSCFLVSSRSTVSLRLPPSVDDEETALLQLKNAVSAWAAQRQHSIDLAAFSSAERFLFAYAENRAFDILLLDVEMEGMSGLELARQLRRDGLRAEIIFITSHFELCGEGYEVDALHYLIKPVSGERLHTVLDRAAQRLSVEAPSIVISCEGETVKLPEQEILYIEAFLHYIAIYTANHEYRVRENLSAERRCRLTAPGNVMVNPWQS